ncbi:hypothetical protein WKM37_000100 [Listeria monocytogenes]|uniref:Phage protein Gp138 N-terminal domain-containing protein n=1 Tax=Listeria monocytogenes TaxID=1639 RepID=A0A823J8S0_LISMN|nr:hypothetical protein [Listeria monocytogenes]EAC5129619.1 hypothetical protein [Listeria monocytogenes]EAE2932115.1 hypothetical protein [Listeria monocytogenes]EAG8119927.1 hypothetical protein [Listeria monocytogenes]EAG9676248.1 hypothetical protein [Listeria monocytogenes]EAG9736072.1 hypothetical protein [Listeria monocytogenes]
MAQDTKFFDSFIRLVNSSVSVLLMCRVVNYDATNKRADVQPLNLKRNGTKRGMIIDALVLKHTEEDMAQGKVVAVVFSDCELDNIQGSGDFKPDSSRQHSVNDAVVVGVWDV